jgi:hypothetical protein
MAVEAIEALVMAIKNKKKGIPAAGIIEGRRPPLIAA